MLGIPKFALLSAFSVAIAMSGCVGGGEAGGKEETPASPIARHPQAIVAYGLSDALSSVDLVTGSVTPNLGDIHIGPTTSRVKIRAGKAYIVNSGAFPESTNASVQVFDVATAAPLATIPFPDGHNPIDIAFASDAKAYVTCLYGNNVTVIDLTKQGEEAIVKTIDLPVFENDSGPVNAGPMGIVVSGRYAYTANCGFDLAALAYVQGSVSVIDTATDTLVDVDNDPSNGAGTPIFTSQVNPQDLDAGPDGTLWVLCTGNYLDEFGVVDVIDPSDRWRLGPPIEIGGSPVTLTASHSAYALIGAGDAVNANLYVVRTDTHAVLHDSSDPLALIAPAQGDGFWMVGKIAASATGLIAYVPIGNTDPSVSKLVEVSLVPDHLEVTRTFDLSGSGRMPSSVALWE